MGICRLSLLLHASIGKIPCSAQSRPHKLGEPAASAAAGASIAEQAPWPAVFSWQQEFLPVLKPRLFGNHDDSVVGFLLLGLKGSGEKSLGYYTEL